MSDFLIEKVIDHMTKSTLPVLQNMVLAIQGDLRRYTPRDTGWAANNWIISKGRPAVHTVGTPDAVINAPQGTVDIITYSPDDFEKGTPVFIANNVPYISRLNNGYSQKRPAGFVQRAIQKGIREAS